MLIKGDNPEIVDFEIQGTTVMCDGSSLLQGEDIYTTVSIFMAWDEATMLLYLELLEDEEAEKNLYDNFIRMAKQSLRE